jgi:hypothetical protein
MWKYKTLNDVSVIWFILKRNNFDVCRRFFVENVWWNFWCSWEFLVELSLNWNIKEELMKNDDITYLILQISCLNESFDFKQNHQLLLIESSMKLMNSWIHENIKISKH